MWFSRHFHDPVGTLQTLEGLTPEQTKVLAEAGRELLKEEAKERLAHTKVIASAAGMRLH